MIERLISLVCDLVLWPFRLGMLLVEIISYPVRAPLVWLLKYLARKNSLETDNISFVYRLSAFFFKLVILAIASIGAIWLLQWILSLSSLTAIALQLHAGLPTVLTQGFFLTQLPLFKSIPASIAGFLHLNSVYFDLSGINTFILNQITNSDHLLNILLAGAAIFSEFVLVAMLISSKAFEAVFNVSQTLKQIMIATKIRSLTIQCRKLDKSKIDSGYLRRQVDKLHDAIG
jgi:hypothetical protein